MMLGKLLRVIRFVIKHRDAFWNFYKCMRFALEDSKVTPQETLHCFTRLAVDILQREGYVREVELWRNFYAYLNEKIQEWGGRS